MIILPQIQWSRKAQDIACAKNILKKFQIENKIFCQNLQIYLYITPNPISRPFQFVLWRTKYLATLRDCAPLMPPNRPNGDGAWVYSDTTSSSQPAPPPTQRQGLSHRPIRIRHLPTWSASTNGRQGEQLPANPFCGLKGEIRLFISSCSVVTWGKRKTDEYKVWKMKKHLQLLRYSSEIMISHKVRKDSSN